jgi:hypothetical protein
VSRRYPRFRTADRFGQRAAETFNAHVAPLATAPEAPPTLPAVDSPEYVKPAYYAVRLGMRRTWVTRRNETFTFLDADTVRRRMSVDFTLPDSSTLKPGDMALVPLMLLVKRDLRNLDVLDSAGNALPVLNMSQHERASVLGLKEVLERLVAGHPDGAGAKEVDEDALTEIVRARPPHKPRPPDEDIATELVGQDGPLDRQLSHADDSIRPQIERFITGLEHYFMLLVPLEYWPGQRQVCKLSYDAAIQPQHASRGARLYTRVNRAVSSFGLAGRVEFFDNLAVGLGESYHAEAVPPRDTYIAEAALAVRRPGSPTDDKPITDSHSFRPHLRATPDQRGDEGKVSLIIHAHRGELLLPLAFSSLLISVVLGFFPAHVYEVEGQTLAALLLVPFALSAFYIRSQENSYVTAMLRGVRALALLPLLAGVWAIGLVALGTVPPEGAALSSGTLAEIRIPFLVAAVPTAILLIATISSGIGRMMRPAIRAQQERSRLAYRRRFEKAQAAGRKPSKRRVQAVLQILAGVLVTLLILGALGYGGWRAASTWWDEAVPTAPRSTLEER